VLKSVRLSLEFQGVWLRVLILACSLLHKSAVLIAEDQAM